MEKWVPVHTVCLSLLTKAANKKRKKKNHHHQTITHLDFNSLFKFTAQNILPLITNTLISSNATFLLNTVTPIISFYWFFFIFQLQSLFSLNTRFPDYYATYFYNTHWGDSRFCGLNPIYLNNTTLLCLCSTLNKSTNLSLTASLIFNHCFFQLSTNIIQSIFQ